MSALRRNHCPDSSGISVRFGQEYAQKRTSPREIILQSKIKIKILFHGVNVKTPMQAIEKWFDMKPEIFKQKPLEFKNKILALKIISVC